MATKKPTTPKAPRRSRSQQVVDRLLEFQEKDYPVFEALLRTEYPFLLARLEREFSSETTRKGVEAALALSTTEEDDS